MRLLRSVFLAVSVMGLSLAACGGSQKGDTTTPEPAAAEETAPADDMGMPADDMGGDDMANPCAAPADDMGANPCAAPVEEGEAAPAEGEGDW